MLVEEYWFRQIFKKSNGGGYVHREVKVEIHSLGTFQGEESDQPGRGDQELPSLSEEKAVAKGSDKKYSYFKLIKD